MSTVSIGASTGLPVQQNGAHASAPADVSAPQTVKEPAAAGDEPPKPYYEFDVTMTCGACSAAVTRVLTKVVDPSQFEVSLEKQRVRVWGENLPPFSDVDAKIAKTGKKINDRKEVTA